MVGFLEIAASTQELDVGVGVTSALGNWNDVIEFQILTRPTVDTLSAVALPDSLPYFSRDVS